MSEPYIKVTIISKNEEHHIRMVLPQDALIDISMVTFPKELNGWAKLESMFCNLTEEKKSRMIEDPASQHASCNTNEKGV